MKDSMVILRTNQENKLFEMSEFEIFGMGSFKTRLKIWSYGFGFENNIYFDNVFDFMNQLEEMVKYLKGEAVLKEEYYDHYVKFKVTKIGHVIVSGVLIDYNNFMQQLEFMIETDQTCLEPFLNDMRKIFRSN